MPQSESTLLEVCERLEAADPSERPAIAPRLHRHLLENPNGWAELSDPVVESLVPHLDAPDPAVRSGALFVLAHVAAHGGEFCEFEAATYTQSEIADRVLDALDDDSARVRQTAARSDDLTDLVEAVLEGEVDVATARLVRVAFDGLRDPAPVVRKRFAAVFYRHGVDLLAAHPEPEAAVTTLLDALADPVVAFGGFQLPGRTPRRVAAQTLRQGLAHYDPELVVARLDDVTALLDDDRRRGRRAAASLLVELSERELVDLDRIGEDVRAAIEAGRFPVRGRRTGRLALAVALEHPGEVRPVYERLRSAVTAENARNDRWSGNEPVLVSLSRLVRASDESFEPAIETLAELVARDTTASADTDPLVLLAEPHPEFVASELRDGYRKLVADGREETRRFDRDLVVEVGGENPAAIEGVPEVLAEGIAERDVRRVLAALVDAHPEESAGVVPEAYERADLEPPLRHEHSELIETTAPYWRDVPEAVADALVETVGATSDAAYGTGRRYAVRALVALHEEGLPVLPDRFEPFVEPCREGVYDDDQGTDPLDTEAAEAAGLV